MLSPLLEQDGIESLGYEEKQTVPKKKPMMAVMYSVQRQPRYDIVIKPPTTGPATGPMKVIAANIATATARSTGSRVSASIPPTFVVSFVVAKENEEDPYNCQWRTGKKITEKPTDKNRLQVLYHGHWNLENSEDKETHKERHIASI